MDRAFAALDYPLMGAIAAYMNEPGSLIGDLVAPPAAVPVKLEEGPDQWKFKYLSWDTRNTFGNAADTSVESWARAPGGKYNEQEFEDSALIEGTIAFFGKVVPIPNERQIALGMELKELKLASTLEMARLTREVEVAGFFQTTSNYDATLVTTLGAAAQWDDAAGTPVLDIANFGNSMAALSGMRPTAAIFGRDVVASAINGFAGNLRGSGAEYKGAYAMETIAQLLGLKRIYAATAVRNTAARGAAKSHAAVWNAKDVILLSQPDEYVVRPAAGAAERIANAWRVRAQCYRFVASNLEQWATSEEMTRNPPRTNLYLDWASKLVGTSTTLAYRIINAVN